MNIPNYDEKEHLLFFADPNKYILMPGNSFSIMAQEKSFELFEKLQEDYINIYHKLSLDERVKMIYDIYNMFITLFFANDSTMFKLILGFDGKGIPTAQEIQNAKRDFEIAKKDKKAKKFRCFFLLDMLPNSNRRADAIIITNEYDIELYDFSEGVIADKLRNYRGNVEDLPIKEQQQFSRKKQQQLRIESYKGKIKPGIDSFDAIIDNESRKVTLFDIDINYFDFTFAYLCFMKFNDKTYIPNSICFLTPKSESSSNYINFKLKNMINNPIFNTQNKISLTPEILEHIYTNDSIISISRTYLNLFFSLFTSLELYIVKRHTNDQLLVIKDGKKKGVRIRDTRTGKTIAFTHGIIYKHIYLNADLESWITYISTLCNTDKSIDFNKKAFLKDKLSRTIFTFFCTKLDKNKDKDAQDINPDELLKDLKWYI